MEQEGTIITRITKRPEKGLGILPLAGGLRDQERDLCGKLAAAAALCCFSRQVAVLRALECVYTLGVFTSIYAKPLILTRTYIG